MGTVTINLVARTIYGTYAAALLYWEEMLGATATAWTAATELTRNKSLVMACKLLDRQVYIDDANTFALRNAITAFQYASYELAGMFIVDPTLYDAVMSGKNIKRIAVDGGPEIEFFNPTLGISGRFPMAVQEYIGPYLGGSELSETSGSFSSGTDGTHTVLDDNVVGESNYDLNRSIP